MEVRLHFLLLSLIWVLGCGYSIITNQRAGVNFTDYETIAVAPLTGSFNVETKITRNNLSGWIAQQLRNRNYLVVDSEEVQKLLELHNYSLDVIAFPIFSRKLGEELKADAILVGEIIVHKGELGDIEILVDIKLYDLKHSEVLWMGKYHDIQQKSYVETISNITNKVLEEIMVHFPTIPK
ncbi:MAG: hypothetical protein ACYSSO_12080 [Planctomycetota bacterium]|jgi:hypothetical protein